MKTKTIALSLAAMATLTYLSSPLFAESPEDLFREWDSYASNNDFKDLKTRWSRLSESQLKQFLKVGVNVNARNSKHWTPLHSCARYNQDETLLKILLEAGADLDARNKSGDTPLHWASAKNENPAVVLALIEAGANVNDRDKFGWSPLHYSTAESSNPEVIKLLLNNGADPSAKAYFFLFTPRFLLKHNHQISDTDKNTLYQQFIESQSNTR